MLLLAVVMDIDESSALETVRLMLALVVPSVAVIVALPTPTAATTPLLSTVAIEVFDDCQVT